MDNQNFKKSKQIARDKFTQAHSNKANSFRILTRLILPVRSLWTDRIDRLLNRFVVVVERSHVLILRATEKDLSRVQEVSELIIIGWKMVRRFAISARLVGCKDSECSSIFEKFVQLLPSNMVDIESFRPNLNEIYTIFVYTTHIC